MPWHTPKAGKRTLYSKRPKKPLALPDAGKHPATTAYYLTRFDELIAIKKTNFKPTLH